jgi:hypothetical protein
VRRWRHAPPRVRCLMPGRAHSSTAVSRPLLGSPLMRPTPQPGSTASTSSDRVGSSWQIEEPGYCMGVGGAEGPATRLGVHAGGAAGCRQGPTGARTCAPCVQPLGEPTGQQAAIPRPLSSVLNATANPGTCRGQSRAAAGSRAPRHPAAAASDAPRAPRLPRLLQPCRSITTPHRGRPPWLLGGLD